MNNIFFQTETGYVDYITRDGFTINLVNPLFSEENYKFWSYPYENFMTDEFKREFPEFSLLNKAKTIKKVDGQLNIEGTVYDAEMEFSSSDTNIIKKQIDFGYKKLNFTDFNINELNYGEINATDIYDYVDSVLDKTYPEINHCFPRIQTNEFEQTENNKTVNYCPLINDTNNGLVKRISSQLDFVKIQNLIKPYIFLLEILKRSFEYLGFTLEGDILNDDDFRFLALDNEGISYTEDKYSSKKLSISLFKSLLGGSTTRIDTFNLKVIGKYKLTIFYKGEFSQFNQKPWQPIAKSTISIKYNGITTIYELKSRIWIDSGLASGESMLKDDNYIDGVGWLLFTLDFPFFNKYTDIEITADTKIGLRTSAENIHSININVNPIVVNDVKEGDTMIIMDNKMELNKFVPEISFSEILNFLKKYGYRIIPRGNSIYVNKIYLNNSKAKEFTFSEVKFPEIIPQKSDAKIIKLSSYDKLKYGKITITDNGILINSEKIFKLKDEITINALPLPIINFEKTINSFDANGNVSKTIQNINCIKEEKDSGAEIRLIKYRGVFNKKNDGLDTSYLLPENAINTYFKNDIKFFHSDNIKWTFISSSEEFKNLKEDDKIYAYKRELVIKNLTKTFVGKDMYQIEFDTLSIL